MGWDLSSTGLLRGLVRHLIILVIAMFLRVVLSEGR